MAIPYVRNRTEVAAELRSDAGMADALRKIPTGITGLDELSRVDYGDEGCITRCGEYVRVDFGGCNSWELSMVYRAFVDFCIENKVTRALLKAGDNDPNAHYRLRDALTWMAERAPIPAEFKLALIPSTRAIEAIYREAQHHLRAAGFNAWVFAGENEAVDWLEGRALGGLAAS
jgi:hypothetical protein